ncbi:MULTISPECIES: hypothetical protein [Nostoc]|nr:MULTISPECIES: hypothetical protein [Nostoc]
MKNIVSKVRGAFLRGTWGENNFKRDEKGTRRHDI